MANTIFNLDIWRLKFLPPNLSNVISPPPSLEFCDSNTNSHSLNVPQGLKIPLWNLDFTYSIWNWFKLFSQGHFTFKSQPPHSKLVQNNSKPSRNQSKLLGTQMTSKYYKNIKIFKLTFYYYHWIQNYSKIIKKTELSSLKLIRTPTILLQTMQFDSNAKSIKNLQECTTKSFGTLSFFKSTPYHSQ